MARELKITYLKKSVKFLEKNTQISEQQVDDLVVKFVRKHMGREEQNVDYKALKGPLKNFFRIRKGNIRVIVSVVDHQIIIEAIVEEIGFRGSVYK